MLLQNVFHQNTWINIVIAGTKRIVKFSWILFILVFDFKILILCDYHSFLFSSCVLYIVHHLMHDTSHRKVSESALVYDYFVKYLLYKLYLQEVLLITCKLGDNWDYKIFHVRRLFYRKSLSCQVSQSRKGLRGRLDRII